MKNAADVVVALENEPSLNARRAIIQQAWKLGILEFFSGAALCYNNLNNWGIKKIPFIDEDPGSSSIDQFHWNNFVDLTNQLQKRTLSGHAARDAVMAAAESCNTHLWNNWYRRILLRDLKCNTTDTIINQELKSIARTNKTALNYLVPVFSCQLAKSAEDHPKKMTGWKLVDIKMDGCRLLTVLDKDAGTVTQYTRNGLINNRFTNITTGLIKMLPHLKQSMVLDGEVMSDNFQQLMKQMNRKRDVDTSDSYLNLFDILPLSDFQKGICAIPLETRHELLVGLTSLFQETCGSSVVVVPKLRVNLDTDEGRSAFNEFNKEALAAGLEGIMVKDPYSPYECKKNANWLKIKPSITVDLTIVGFEPGEPESRFSHTLGNLVCEGTDNGKFIRVSVGGGFSEKQRDEFWNNQSQLMGMIVEIEADVISQSQGSTDIWSLRFPRFKRFRGDTPGDKY